MSDHRIVVIGSGVAGMSAARGLILAGYRPLLIAPLATVPSRGETLSPRATPLLKKLGWLHLLADDVAIRSNGRFSVWGSTTMRQAELEQEPSFHIDRAGLEAKMWSSLAQAGIDRQCHPVTRLEHTADGVAVHFGNSQLVDTAAVIDCTGRAALSSGPSSKRRRADRLVALWATLDLADDAETLAATLVEAVELGWWYTSILPGRRLMVGFFTDSDLLPTGASRVGVAFGDMLTNAPNTKARLESLGLLAVLAHCPREVSPAASVIGSRMVEGRILRAGDAAAATDPLSSNGLATAIWSGAMAGEAALALLQDDQAPAEHFERSYLEGIARQLGSQTTLYGAESRFTNAPFWSRRSQQSLTVTPNK
ncbi:MAG: dehydrogenase [Sphingobacteriales bacterium]|nr:MAG: dehydrogenase [Sphingobacteriales bacterium]